MGFGLAALATLTLAAAATAQNATLTVDDGRALIVGGADILGSGLTPTDLDAAALVGELRRLCLPDPGGAGGRVGGSPLELDSEDVVFASSGKQSEARIAQWRGESAALLVWTGDDQGLRGRPIAMPSRAAVTTGPYGPFRASGVQCNLVFRVNSFADVAAITNALSSAFGTPGKLVAKNTFADGYWSVPGTTGPVRININVPTTRAGPQPVHLSAQVRGKDQKR